MSKVVKLIAAAGAAFLMASAAQAGASLFAGRVGAVHVAKLAKFYESAFGLKQVNELKFPGSLEIMMNFGDTEAAAKANPSPQVVVMHRATDRVKDTVPHLIFSVTDIEATAAAVKAAGGKMLSPPRAFGKTGMYVGIAVDPAGNRLELIQQPRH
jgi:predicted enzyme related to lactoylglutathione lyase